MTEPERTATPPRISRLILRLLLPGERFESIAGDLEESFADRAEERGVRYARARYRRDVRDVIVRAPGTWRRRGRRNEATSRAWPGLPELRYSLRRLAKQPSFTVTVVLTLALGIGATTAVVSVARTLLATPEAGDGRVVLIWGTNRIAGQARDVISGPTYLDLQRENQSLASLAAFHFGDLTLRESSSASVVTALHVTPEFFTVTGVTPILGRGFEPADAQSGDELVVLSYGFWQRRFGGDPSIVGRSLAGMGSPHVVMGVLPPRFRFLDVPDLVTLLKPQQMAREERTYYFYWLVGRLRDGVSLQAADEDLDGVMSRIAAAHPSARGWEVTAESIAELLREPVRPAALVAITTVGLVLLIACANVASLVLTRNIGRRRELSLRLALGASRQRIFLELLADIVCVAVAGGVAGIGAAAFGIAALNRLMPPALALGDSAASVAVPALVFDRTTFIIAGCVSALTVALCGLLPAWRASRHDAQPRLTSTRGATDGPAEQRLRSVLVAIEAALATVLLVTALLLLQTISNLRAVDPGFRGDGVLATAVGRVDELLPDARARYYSEVLRRVAEVPGVNAVALNDYLLLTNEDDYEGVEIEGRPRLASGGWPREEWRRVSPDYFQILRIPLIRGRIFTRQDDADAASVVLINEAMARKYWPGEDPVGRRIRLTARAYGWSEIVGIVGDVHEVGVDHAAKPMMFVPYHRNARPVMALFARTDGDPERLLQPIQRAIWTIDPSRPVFNARRVDRLLSDSMAMRRLAEQVSGGTAVLAIAMTIVGIYGTLSYVVAQRRREIGLRLAIGAGRSDIVGLVIREGTRPAVVGLAVGIAAGSWVAALSRSYFFGISAFDPGTYALAAALLITAVLAASSAPAWRASRVDPSIALEAD